MQSKVRHILIVRKANSDRAARLEAEIGAWLRARGHAVTTISGGFDDPAYAIPDLDFVVVLGGDGTMLGVARRVAGRGIPLLGINFGRVGFLADVQPEQWEQGLADALAGISPERSCLPLLRFPDWRKRVPASSPSRKRGSFAAALATLKRLNRWGKICFEMRSTCRRVIRAFRRWKRKSCRLF